MSLLLEAEPFTQSEQTFIEGTMFRTGGLHVLLHQSGPNEGSTKRIVSEIFDGYKKKRQLGIIRRYPSSISFDRTDVNHLTVDFGKDGMEPLKAYKMVFNHILTIGLDCVLIPELRDEADVYVALELKAVGIVCITTIACNEKFIFPCLEKIGLPLNQITSILR